MRRTLTIAALAGAAILVAAPFAAVQAKDSTGCGLGSTIFAGESGVVTQVIAVTTNGTSGNQTFGITSGTSGCDQDGVIEGDKMASMFLGDNLDKVARDASRGEGENLESLATLLGVEQQHHAAFYQAARQNFGTIFASENVTAGQVLASLRQVMADDAVLSRYVQV